MKDVLFLETRKKLFVLLQNNPGLHLSTIAKRTGMSVALADYHLRYMVQNEIVTEIKEGGYKRYYVKGEQGTEEKKLLALLQQDIPLRKVRERQDLLKTILLI